MAIDNKYQESALTEKLIGIAFEVYKQIGSKYPEKIYQEAYKNKLEESELAYKRELYCKLECDGKRVGFFKLDFLVENKVVIELKVRNEIFNSNIAQLLTYIRLNKIKVGLVLAFAKNKVLIKRMVL